MVVSYEVGTDEKGGTRPFFDAEQSISRQGRWAGVLAGGDLDE